MTSPVEPVPSPLRRRRGMPEGTERCPRASLGSVSGRKGPASTDPTHSLPIPPAPLYPPYLPPVRLRQRSPLRPGPALPPPLSRPVPPRRDGQTRPPAGWSRSQVGPGSLKYYFDFLLTHPTEWHLILLLLLPSCQEHLTQHGISGTHLTESQAHRIISLGRDFRNIESWHGLGWKGP